MQDKIAAKKAAQGGDAGGSGSGSNSGSGGGKKKIDDDYEDILPNSYLDN